MSSDRVADRLRRMASRMGERIDLLRSTIDDLEIEFEVMQRALNRFDSRHAIDRRARIEAAYEAFEDDLMDRDGAVSVPLSDMQQEPPEQDHWMFRQQTPQRQEPEPAPRQPRMRQQARSSSGNRPKGPSTPTGRKF